MQPRVRYASPCLLTLKALHDALLQGALNMRGGLLLSGPLIFALNACGTLSTHRALWFGFTGLDPRRAIGQPGPNPAVAIGLRQLAGSTAHSVRYMSHWGLGRKFRFLVRTWVLLPVLASGSRPLTPGLARGGGWGGLVSHPRPPGRFKPCSLGRAKYAGLAFVLAATFSALTACVSRLEGALALARGRERRCCLYARRSN